MDRLVGLAGVTTLALVLGGCLVSVKTVDDGEAFARRCLLPENLAKAGRGILLEVDEEGGDQVLIWLR